MVGERRAATIAFFTAPRSVATWAWVKPVTAVAAGRTIASAPARNVSAGVSANRSGGAAVVALGPPLALGPPEAGGF